MADEDIRIDEGFPDVTRVKQNLGMTYLSSDIVVGVRDGLVPRFRTDGGNSRTEFTA